MKTTFNIEERVMTRLKQEAARRGCTMSELVESALRLLLDAETLKPPLSPLPTLESEGRLVNIDNRDPLYRAMEDPTH